MVFFTDRRSSLFRRKWSFYFSYFVSSSPELSFSGLVLCFAYRFFSSFSAEISRNFKKMAKRYRSLYFIAILVAVFVSAPPAVAFTDLLDVVALRDLYKTLNQPPQLKGWSLDSGDDPCELWYRVSCLNYSVVELDLNGLNLSGYITPEMYNLYNLKHLDISSNSIGGEIPYVLPPRLIHVNMAYNHLIQNIPPSLPGMKSLRYLNLSHNLLSGPIGNVFTGLQNLREMDLSYNNFTGDLPSSFGSLTNLTGLYLQNNKFTGSVAYLAELPLIDLNIKDNSFSGIIPSHFQSIPNLWIGGNSFRLPGDNYPPWDFPLETQGGVIEQDIHPPSATQSSAMEKSNPSTKVGGHRKWGFGPKGIALVIGGGTVVVSCVIVYILVRYSAYRFNKLRAQRLGASSSSRSFTVISTSKVLTTDTEPYGNGSMLTEETESSEEELLPPHNNLRLMCPRPQVMSRPTSPTSLSV
uniref:protein STRUBBELIG-RECEPTOR FAMILY 2-like isoform X1 n=1 Tax=Fragaria vesca subsp. vesca TaxID=101020 RepID=UPI0005C870DB|nr:PREDICTED: protein STRUBBELIG-RECEPTOR FAMILY 2-like isoform X1 [Fragaria vesca subsp. vesca]